MTDDPRVEHLNAVAAKVCASSNCTYRELETLLFLARYDAVQVLEDIGRGMTGAEHVSRLLGSGYAQVDNDGAKQWVTSGDARLRKVKALLKEIKELTRQLNEARAKVSELAIKLGIQQG